MLGMNPDRTHFLWRPMRKRSRILITVISMLIIASMTVYAWNVLIAVSDVAMSAAAEVDLTRTSVWTCASEYGTVDSCVEAADGNGVSMTVSGWSEESGYLQATADWANNESSKYCPLISPSSVFSGKGAVELHTFADIPASGTRISGGFRVNLTGIVPEESFAAETITISFFDEATEALGDNVILGNNECGL